MRIGSNRVGRGWTAKGGKIRKDQDGTKACSDRRQLKHKQAKENRRRDDRRCRFVSQPGVGGRESIEVVHSKVCLNVEGGDD